LARKLSETASPQNLLSAVAETSDIEGTIRRIAVFDHSHLGGTNQLGGMIVATEDGFVKNQYRKFNIKNADTVPGDDYAMMQEVLTRGYERMVREENADSSNRPDLILIDGGKGQLGIARKVMAELGLDIPLIGIAKGPDRNAGREQFFMPGRDVFNLPPNSPVLYYLQRLRDEAHRFAIGGHRIKRKKDIRANPLDDISGIGNTSGNFGSTNGTQFFNISNASQNWDSGSFTNNNYYRYYIFRSISSGSPYDWGHWKMIFTGDYY